MRFDARIYVTLRKTVNDPQGLTVRGALQSLGYAGISAVRVGKYIEIAIEALDEDSARVTVGEMCAKLLANPVIEEYRFDLVPGQLEPG